MSVLSKIPIDTIIEVAKPILEPVVAKVWHLLTGTGDDHTTVKQLAAQAGKDLAARAIDAAEAKLGIGAQEKITANLADLALHARALGASVDAQLGLMQTIDERNAVIRELEGKVEQLERENADLRSTLTGGVQ